MKRRAFYIVLGAILFGVPLRAQISGRWKLILENGGPSWQGELVVTDSGGITRGAVLLESRDSMWMPLRDMQVEGATLQFTVAVPDPLRFSGRLVGDALEGTASSQSTRRVRWRGVRLEAHQEYYAALPRFRQRQIRLGTSQPHFVLPGKWLAAAAALGETVDSVEAGYTELALRSGLTPLSRDSIATSGLLRAMGLFRREELMRTSVATLVKIRANLPTDSSRSLFDHLFRPAGSWQVDLHDVALARAQRPFPTLTWESTRNALNGARLLETREGVDVVPLALYRLFVLSQNDSAEFTAREQLMRRVDAASFTAVTALLNAYREAADWYVTALRFLLEQPWIRVGGNLVTPAELVRRQWNTQVTVPEIRVRLYGYPEGSVRVGADSGLVSSVLIPENASARDWLSRHGHRTLVSVVHQLALPYDATTRVRAGDRLLRLNSVQQYARESFSGFFEPADAILLDPSYQPLLALGTLVHEWQHILHERARLASVTPGYTVRGEEIFLTQPDPFLAEGLAEWLTEGILAPAARDFPLVLFGEAEKRVSLPQSDPHQLGYIMVRTLGRTLGDSAAHDVLRRAAAPSTIMNDPRVRRAWASYRASDRMIPRRGDEVLLPLVVFTIEDAFPDLVQSEIIAPYIPRP